MSPQSAIIPGINRTIKISSYFLQSPNVLSYKHFLCCSYLNVTNTGSRPIPLQTGAISYPQVIINMSFFQNCLKFQIFIHLYQYILLSPPASDYQCSLQPRPSLHCFFVMLICAGRETQINSPNFFPFQRSRNFKYPLSGFHGLRLSLCWS